MISLYDVGGVTAFSLPLGLTLKLYVLSVCPQCLDARTSSHGAGQATVWEDEETEEGGDDHPSCHERTGDPLLPARHKPAWVL